MMHKKILTDIGMTDREAKIYLSALQLGVAPASSIARQCNENRVTVYTILKQMAQRGYVEETNKDGTKYYTVISPEDLLEEHQEKVKKLAQHMPELIGMMNTSCNKPRLLFYEGLDGLKKVYNDFLATEETYSVFLGTASIHPDFLDFLENDFLPRRMQCKTKCKAIVSKKSNTDYAEFNKKTHEAIVIDDPIFDIANEIIVFNHTKVAVCLYSQDDLSAIVIDSRNFHDCMLGIFNIIRKVYKKHDV